MLYDFTFSVTDGTNTYQIAVIDVDLDNDGRVDSAGEDGYYLIFIGTPPPPDTMPSIANPLVHDSSARTHAALGGQAVCFLRGTLIQTDRGPRPVETLCPGDRVQTADNGYQPLMMLAMRRADGRAGQAPVRIARGVLGNRRDLWLSPQHRMLITGWRAELAFGEAEVLVPAVGLLGRKGITRRPMSQVLYCHLLFERHEVIFAEGAASESLHLGRQAVRGMAPEAVAMLDQLLPGFDPKDPDCGRHHGRLARYTPTAREATVLGALAWARG